MSIGLKRTFAILAASVISFLMFACAGTAPPDDGKGPDKGDVAYKTTVLSREVIGNGGYGAVFNAQIDPYNGEYFGATCDMGSVYFSFDCGESWIRHNVQGTVYCLKYDSATDGVVWAAGSGVYKSTDHGKTLELVFPKASEVKYAGHNYENANYWLYTDKTSDYAPHYQIWSMAIDRKSGGNKVFVGQRVSSAGMGYNKCVRIYRATDGENFSLFTELPYEYNFKLDYDEVNDCLIYITKDRILEIDGSGNVACTVEQPVYVQFSGGNNIAFDSCYDAVNNRNTFVFSAPSSEEHVAAACYKTNDVRDKSTYVDITQPLVSLTTDDLGIKALHDYDKGRPSYEYCEWIKGKTVPQRFDWTIAHVSALSDDVIYLFHEANTDTFDSDNSFYIKRRTMIYLRYDGRKPVGERYRWVFGFPHKPYNTAIQNTSWPDADSDYCFGMSSSPANDMALLYCSNVGIYYTSDCDTVKQLYNNVHGSDELTCTSGSGDSAKRKLQRVSTKGVDVLCTHTVATDPFDSSHLLMGCTDVGLLQSYDNGKTWYHGLLEWQNGELKSIAYAAYTNTCFDIHFDTVNKNVVYGLWSLAKTAPYAPGASYLTGQARFGVSYDGGLSWTMKKITSDGCCQPYRMQVVYDGDGRDIYIATFSHGIFFTSDLGATFRTMNDGLPRSTVGDKTAIWANDIVVCDLGIFAITGGYAGDGTENAGHGFFKWDEAGERFEKIELPLSRSAESGKDYAPGAVRDIEYDGKNKCLYIACTANVVNSGSKLVKISGGILKYKDGSFSQIYDETASVFAVNLDGSGRLYATELNGRIARFDDDGRSYEILADGLFHMLKRVCFGATDDILYVPTWGGGTEKLVLGKKQINA